MQRFRGMTLIGMLLTMAIVICAGIVVMRVVPVYLSQYELVTSIKALNTLPATEFTTDPASNAHVLRTKLLNQLYVNSIESIAPEQIVITPAGENIFQLSIKYQVIRPLVGNVSLLFDFDTSQEVKVSAE